MVHRGREGRVDGWAVLKVDFPCGCRSGSREYLGLRARLHLQRLLSPAKSYLKAPIDPKISSSTGNRRSNHQPVGGFSNSKHKKYVMLHSYSHSY